MSIIKIVIMVIVITTIPTLVAADSVIAPKTHEQNLIELVDMFCFKNQVNFSVIDEMILMMGGKDLGKEITAMDQAIAHMGGKSFLIKYEDENYMVGYTIGGGCAVFSETLNETDAAKILTDNYKVRLIDTITEGMQIQKLFEFTNSSLLAKGLVSITHAKKITNIKSGSIGFVPSHNLGNALSQNHVVNATSNTSCTLPDEKKSIYREALCRGNAEYSSTTGPKCQEDMLQKRINDSAYQIVSGERCGFSSYSSQLNNQLIGVIDTMQVLYDCIGVPANTKIMLKKAFAHANRTAPAAGKCPTKLRSRLKVRLPVLVRQGNADISERETLLRNIGAK